MQKISLKVTNSHRKGSKTFTSVHHQMCFKTWKKQIFNYLFFCFLQFFILRITLELQCRLFRRFLWTTCGPWSPRSRWRACCRPPRGPCSWWTPHDHRESLSMIRYDYSLNFRFPSFENNLLEEKNTFDLLNWIWLSTVYCKLPIQQHIFLGNNFRDLKNS